MDKSKLLAKGSWYKVKVTKSFIEINLVDSIFLKNFSCCNRLSWFKEKTQLWYKIDEVLSVWMYWKFG